METEKEKDKESTAESKPLTSTTKTARQFDVQEMVNAILQAKSSEKSIQQIEVEATNQDSDDQEEGSDDNDDMIGPMPVPAVSSPAEMDKKQSGQTREQADVSTSKKRSKDDPDEEQDKSSGDEDSDDDDVDSEEDINAEKYFFPTTERVTLQHGSKPISALTIDPTGTRFATGSYDYEVKMWDFTGLKNRHAFRSMRPCESHPIRNLSYSSNGDSLLIISGNAQAKVVDRDGTELLECIKGDQYIVDMARTKGHISSLTGGQFNPKQKNIFLTSSDDGTCRLWDVNNSRQHKTCVKLRSSAGLKNSATTCCFGRDGNTFVGAGYDGNLNMWDTRKPLVVPTAVMKNAHQKNTDTFHVTYSHSGLQLVSRGEDAVVNIWDVRNWKQTLWKSGNYPAKHTTTDVCFSPDDRYLLIPSLPIGFSGRSKDEAITHSNLYFLSMNDFTHHNEVVFQNDILIRSVWNHRINQIIVSLASGAYCIMYDLNKSQRGAILFHGQQPKKIRQTDVIENLSSKMIITPNSLPLFKTDKPRNRRREETKARLDPVKSQRPDLPITAGSGGRVAASGSTLSSYVIRNLGLSKSVKDDLDPREAILRYAKDAAENPIWVTPAYKKTQPHPIFMAEDDEPDKKKPKL